MTADCVSPPSSTLARPDRETFAVIVPEADRAKLELVCKRAGLAVVTLETLVADYGFNRDRSGRIVSVEAPAIFVGAVFTSDAGESVLAAEAEALALFCSLLGYDQHRVVLATDPDLPEWLAMRITSAAEMLVQDSVGLRRALATLRAEHEDMLKKFAAVEGAAASGTPRRTRKLHFPSTRTIVTLPPSGYGGDGSFTQRLPLAPKGLAAIVLEVSRKPRGPAAELQVTLKLARGAEAVQEWRIATKGLDAGPLALRLQRALDRNGMDVLLEIRLEGEQGSEFSLNLSSPTPLDEYSLTTNTGVIVGAPLALTAWGSAPGLSVADDLTDDAPHVANEPSLPNKAIRRAAQRYPLFADELEQAVRIEPVEVSQNFNNVDFRRDEGDLLVHPLDGETIVALIPNLSHRQIEAISATVVVDNVMSASVEFGLAIVSRQLSYKVPSDLIKRWTRVEPLVYAEVQGEMLAEPGRPVDLLLATRMVDGASANLAWAFFKRIEIVA